MSSSIGRTFLKELLLESEVTRKFLELVPFDKASYKPAEKSESLGRLAIHVAEITSWWSSCVYEDKLDFEFFVPADINSTDGLLIYFDQLLEKAKEALLNVDDKEFEKEWSMVYGKELLFSLPKYQVARIFCMNHLVHHRAQLGVYLRLLDIPLPAVYGPSADDEEVITVNPFTAFKGG